MYPNTFYRVSIKAYITDEKGRVFVVKENDNSGNSWWGLPGGGLDHGELPSDCLRREIKEELGIDDIVVGSVAYTKAFYLDRKDAWLLWIVYRAKIDTANYVYADGVTDSKFIAIDDLRSSEDMFEQAVVEVDQALRS